MPPALLTPCVPSRPWSTWPLDIRRPPLLARAVLAPAACPTTLQLGAAGHPRALLALRSASARLSVPFVSFEVLHDLLRSFCIERPLSSSRVPPWDLLRVLSLLRGPPFEPFSSCLLRDLSRKVLFFVALATTRRVGELQAISSSVSFSGDDIFLSYLLESRAKSESASNPLPLSFCVRSLRDFVGNITDELLLCPVRALRIYLQRTSSSLSAASLSLCVPSFSDSSSFQKCLKFFPLQCRPIATEGLWGGLAPPRFSLAPPKVFT